MKSFNLLASLACTQVALAHISIYGVWKNGEWQGDGREVYERTKFNVGMNAPVRNVDWSYIACHTFGHRERPTYLEVKAGDIIAPEWFWLERGDFYTDSHRGPPHYNIRIVLVYMAPAIESGPNTPGIWTKLYHYGYNTTDNLWADEYFEHKPAEETKGHHWITIPDVPAGDYLIRSEIITLQEAERVNGAQHYPSCIQVRVTSDGTKTLPGGVSFPGNYAVGQTGIVWPPLDGSSSDPADYPLPGGPVWEESPGGGIYNLQVTLTDEAVTLDNTTVSVGGAFAGSGSINRRMLCFIALHTLYLVL
ncbi:glycosyl hydrolase family 61-domain-containing protein [Coprinopsis sp. MPI-PUGE-AT-0042]|nr:glycosyl hydrolase family 61-domain-containing protein [Coprinopsis sp. MPI-PUGE-AT-0042]